jgi:hypothetical protein
LFAREPVRAVRFADTSGNRGVANPVELFFSPAFQLIRDVQFKGRGIDGPFFQAMDEAPYEHIEYLETLRLVQTPADDESTDYLCSVLNSNRLSNLVGLEIGPDISPAVLSPFLNSVIREQLSSLTLFGHSANSHSVREIANWSELKGLDTLRLYVKDSYVNSLKAAGATVLPEAESLRNLRELTIHGHDLRLRGTIAFAKAAQWPLLERLSLQGNQIPPGAVPAFVANRSFVSLRELDLRSNPLTQSDVEPIREAFPELQIWTDDFYSNTSS